MSHPYPSQARVIFLLLLVAFSLQSCLGNAAPAPPVGGEPPAPPRPTHTAARAPAVPEPTRTPTPLPTATPLLKIETPIVWYLRGTAPQDLAQVVSRLNQVLDARGFRAQVDIRVIDWSVYDARMAEVQAENRPWDLVSITASSYPGWLAEGGLLPLTAYPNPATGRVENLLETRLPGLRAGLPAQAWAGLLRSGEIYAIPNQGAWASPRGFSIRADVVSALDLQADLARVHTYADLSPLLAKVQAALDAGVLENSGVANGDAIRQVAGRAGLLLPENAGYDVLWGPFVVRYDDPRGAIVNWYQTPEFHDLAALRLAWQQAGYLPGDTLTPEQAGEGYRAGQYIVEVGRPVWAGSAPEQAQRYGYEWIDKPLSPSFLSTVAVLSSLTGVNARIAIEPERVRRVLLFLEWLHTDAEIYNLLAYGVEGRHWQWRDREKGVISLAPGSQYRPDFIAQLGDRTLAYVADSSHAGAWQAAGRENALAPASVALGFRFDPRPVAAEAAAIRGITPELEDPLANGQAEDITKAVGKLQKALEEAGLGAVQAEVEQQFSAWKR